MRDIILQGFIKAFAKEFNYTSLGEGDLFERFVAFCVVSQLYPNIYDIEELIIGGGHDTGIDTIAILVNGGIVTHPEEIQVIIRKQNFLDVQFIFIQSKTEPRFKAEKIDTFLIGAFNFFQENSLIPESDSLKEFKEVKKVIYDNSSLFKSNPHVELYYATFGEWLDDATVVGRINLGRERLNDTNLFSKVQFVPLDANSLRLRYQEIKRKITKTIRFEHSVVFPDSEGVKQAYIGLLSCKEFINLITRKDGNLDRNVFYENIRDYLGDDNPVNQKIYATLVHNSDQDKFSILNNGVTIVAKSINVVGNNFHLHDFQIVNGCQTSNIIFRCREQINSKTTVVVKLIEPEETDLIPLIIEASNKQTELKDETFEALKPFHQDLEQFYKAVGDEININSFQRLYYERRFRQYQGANILRHQIISMPMQLKCFISMFLNHPHSIHVPYNELLAQFRSRVFNNKHSLWPYYTSAITFRTIDKLIFNGEIYPHWLKTFRYHLIFLFSYLQGRPPSITNEERSRRYCEKLLILLHDIEKTKSRFIHCAKIIQQAIRSFDNQNRHELARLKLFTEELIKKAENFKQR